MNFVSGASRALLAIKQFMTAVILQKLMPQRPLDPGSEEPLALPQLDLQESGRVVGEDVLLSGLGAPLESSAHIFRTPGREEAVDAVQGLGAEEGIFSSLGAGSFRLGEFGAVAVQCRG